jgi:hypothetical protein
MNPSPANPPGINPARLLPPEWDKSRDVLLIVGEGASQIAAPFVQYGLKRVITMYPDGITPDAPIPGATSASSRGEFTSIVNLYPMPHPQRYATIRTPGCSLSEQTTQAIQQLLTDLVKRKRSNQASLERLAPLWATNGVRNLTAVASNPLITDIGDAFSGVPLIIVGAGPSLAKNIEHLKEAQDKAIILCVNRALRSLQNAGIQPDLTINLEPQDVAAQFNGIDLTDIHGVVLAASSHSPLYSLNAKHLISYCANQVVEGWMFDPSETVHEVPSGGSVSCSAMSVALQWGCSPIILIGQDLSFEGGAYYHSDGADGNAKAVFDEATQQWQLRDYSADLAHTLADRIEQDGLRFSGASVPGYFGGTVQTSTDFAAFRAWFESTALDHKGHVEMYNCTEGGAYIDGMSHKPLAAVMDTLPVRTLRVDDVLLQITPPLEKRTAWAKQRRDALQNDLDKSVKLAERCMTLAEKAPRKPSAMHAFDQAQTEIRPILRRLPPLNLMAQKGIRQAILDGQNARSDKQSMKANQALYRIIYTSCCHLQDALKN